MKRITAMGSALLLLVGFTAGCIVVNVERKPDAGTSKKSEKAAVEVDVTADGEVSTK